MYLTNEHSSESEDSVTFIVNVDLNGICISLTSA